MRPLPSSTADRLVIACVVTAVIVVVNLALGGKIGPVTDRPVNALALGLAGATVLALLLFRVSAVLGLAAVVAGSIAYTTSGFPVQPGQFALGVALVLAYVNGARTAAIVVGLAMTVAAAVVGPRVVDEDSILLMGRVFMLALPTVPLVAGALFALARDRNDALEQQLSLVRRTAEAEAARDSAKQRLVIARDLHDAVGHNIAIISLQSGAAMQVIEDDPASARSSLEVINDAGRQAMAETKKALGALRSGHGWTAPALETTVLTARETGLEVSLDLRGPLDDLDEEVDGAIRRIAQESLTNTLRHADAKTVSIVLDVREPDVRFSYRDDGRGAEPGSGHAGFGISGMAERVNDLGGDFNAGEVDDGFLVEAVIPTRRMS